MREELYMSQETLFTFLRFFDEDYIKIALTIEEQLFTDPHSVLMKSRLFAEKIAKDVMKQEEYEEDFDARQIDRIRLLQQEGILPDQMYEKFDWLRKAGNKAAHESTYGTIDHSIAAYRYLYLVSSWFFETYGPTDQKVPSYRLPTPKQQHIDTNYLQSLITESVEKTIAQALDSKFEMLKESLAKVEKKEAPVIEETDEDKESKEVASSTESNTTQAGTPIDEYLNKQGLTIIDKRSVGGRLWVIGPWELNEVLFPLKGQRIYFRFNSQGAQATNGEPAWYLMNRKPVEVKASSNHSQISTKLEKENESKRDSASNTTSENDDSISHSSQSELADYLRSQNLEVIDKRKSGGTIWVLGSWEHKEVLFALKEQKIYFRLVQKGSRTTKNKPAWFLMNKNNDHLLVTHKLDTKSMTDG